MDSDEIYSGVFLNALNLQGRAHKLIIAGASLEAMPNGGKSKIALRFTRGDKSLLLNATNKNAIRDVFGKNTDDWIGKAIELYPDRTMYNGQAVACIRVRVPGAPAAAPQAATPPSAADLEDDIPW